MFRTLCFTALVLLAGSACAEDPTNSDATGTLKVITHTSGATPDTNGYTLSVTGFAPHVMDMNDTVFYADLPIGDYAVNLTGVAGNCTVTDGAFRTPYVPVGTTTVDFFVPCP
jgi:hypothetical protein